MLNPARRPRSTRWIDASPCILDSLEPRLLLTFNPTADEQYMLELVNRFRLNPQAELGYMTSSLGAQARSSDPNIDSALRFFQTSGTVLAQQWQSLTAVPPVAWNAELTAAAEFHTLAMIDADMQEHELPGEPGLGQRATNAGYNWSTLGESIFAFARSVFHGHAGFLLDWGNGPNGIQDPPGHRNTAISPNFREIGIRIIPEGNSSTSVGPLVMTLDFGSRFNIGGSWLVGVAYDDSTDDGFYSPGEGIGGATVQVRRSNDASGEVIAMTTTMSAGGYQVLLGPGTYNITFSGGAFGAGLTHRDVVVGASNVKVDGRLDLPPPEPEVEVWGGPLFDQIIFDGDASPVQRDSTYWGDVNLATTAGVERTFFVFNRGNANLNLIGARVLITGTDSSRFTVVKFPDAVIPPGGQSDFRIRFTPDTAHGLRNATVMVLSTDLDEGTFDFAVRARGVARPILNVKGKGRVIHSGDTTPTTKDLTNFGGVRVEEDAVMTRAFRLFNNGSSALNVFGIDLLGDNAQDFVLLSLPATSIEPGTAITFRIRFNPSAPGMRHATVRIRTNDADRSPWTYAIRGNGLATPEIEIRGMSDAAILDGQGVGADDTVYPSLPVSNRAHVKAFRVYNLGTKVLNFTSATRVNIAGPNAADFTLKLDLPSSLAPGASAMFTVRFDPTAQGERSALITILSNDASEGVFTFFVSGVGA